MMLENRFRVLEQVEGESGKSEVLVIGDSQVSRLGPQISKQPAKKQMVRLKSQPSIYLSVALRQISYVRKLPLNLKRERRE